MNNSKGQVLVLFVILLPILIMVLALVVDLGLLYVNDKQIESSMREVVQYALKNQDDVEILQKVTELLNKNIDDIDDIDIKKEENYFQLTVKKQYEGLFKGFFSTNIYQITNHYYGYINEGQLIINKE